VLQYAASSDPPRTREGAGCAGRLVEDLEMEMGYCVKCKASKEIKDPKQVTMKNGRPAMQGKCPDCGTGIYKILPKAK
jgi:hypothetical protein